MRMESALTSTGQATIPKAVREYLGLKPGDRVKFFLNPDWHGGAVAEVAGEGPAGDSEVPAPISLEEMDKAVSGGAVGPSKRR